jgi:hypothetical protein
MASLFEVFEIALCSCVSITLPLHRKRGARIRVILSATIKSRKTHQAAEAMILNLAI